MPIGDYITDTTKETLREKKKSNIDAQYYALSLDLECYEVNEKTTQATTTQATMEALKKSLEAIEALEETDDSEVE